MIKQLRNVLRLKDAGPHSVGTLAELGTVTAGQAGQFELLIRHFWDRLSSDGPSAAPTDARGRAVLLAFASGMPSFVIALYLYPVYHPFIWLHGRYLSAGVPGHWLQVNHHFFFVIYSFAVMGIVAVFHWDSFFPDIIDVYILKTLPIPHRTLFGAQTIAIAIFLTTFVIGTNLFSAVVLALVTSPSNIARFFVGHCVSVACSGLFAAVLMLACQALVLGVLGERTFRRLSLLLQGIFISIFTLLLLLFPAFSAIVPHFIQSSKACFYIPPFWFLGMYEYLAEGIASPSIFRELTQTGSAILSLTSIVAVVAYPMAYARRVRQLIEGGDARLRYYVIPFQYVFHATFLTNPIRRAVFHFISQTVARVSRYRVYLVLYGGIGLAIVISSVLRASVTNPGIHLEISRDGLSAAIAVAAFWTVTGLRVAFVSSGNRQASWIFHIIHGRPAHFAALIEQLRAGEVWVIWWTSLGVVGLCLALQVVAPPTVSTVSLLLVRIFLGMTFSLLFTDLFFVNVTSVAFTGDRWEEESNLAIMLVKFVAFVPIAAYVPIFCESWIALSYYHFIFAVIAAVMLHIVLRRAQRSIILENCSTPQDDLESSHIKLGLQD